MKCILQFPHIAHRYPNFALRSGKKREALSITDKASLRSHISGVSRLQLLVDVDDNAGTDGTATLTDSETQALLNGDGGDQLHVHVDVIARHAHLNALGQGDDTGNVGGTEVELRTITIEERDVTVSYTHLTLPTTARV